MELADIKEKVTTILGGIIAIVVIGFGFLSIGTVVTVMPDNAKVIISNIGGIKLYHSPIDIEPKCIGERELSDNVITELNNNGIIAIMTAGDAKQNGYGICDICRDKGGFVYDSGSLVEIKAKEILGIKQKRRWENNGDWNW